MMNSIKGLQKIRGKMYHYKIVFHTGLCPFLQFSTGERGEKAPKTRGMWIIRWIRWKRIVDNVV